MKITISYTWGTLAVGAAALFLLALAIVAPMILSSDVPAQPVVSAMQPTASQPTSDVDVEVKRNSVSTANTQKFTVTLNTHSGDLSTYDAQANVVYRTADGRDVSATTVGGDRETHHRVLTVSFDAVSLPGSVVVKNLRGVPERAFPFNQ